MSKSFKILIGSVSAAIMASSSLFAFSTEAERDVRVTRAAFQKASEFSRSKVDEAANFALCAYGKHRSSFESKLRDQGYEIDTFSGTTGVGVADEAGIIGYRGNKVLVAFSGTEDLNHWVANLWISKRSAQAIGCAGSVHGGFATDYASVQAELKAKIIAYAVANGFSLSELEIIFTGHSKGAAAATLAAADFVQDGSLFGKSVSQKTADEGFTGIEVYGRGNEANNVKVISFASPRVGDDDFAAQMDRDLGVKNHFRLAVYGDVVPAVPFGSLLGFKHTGTYVPMSLASQLAYDEGDYVGTVANVVCKAQAGTIDMQDIQKVVTPLVSFVRAALSLDGQQVLKTLVAVAERVHSAQAYAANAGAAFEEHQKGTYKHQGMGSRVKSLAATVKRKVSNAWGETKSLLSGVWSKAKVCFG